MERVSDVQARDNRAHRFACLRASRKRKRSFRYLPSEALWSSEWRRDVPRVISSVAGSCCFDNRAVNNAGATSSGLSHVGGSDIASPSPPSLGATVLIPPASECCLLLMSFALSQFQAKQQAALHTKAPKEVKSIPETHEKNVSIQTPTKRSTSNPHFAVNTPAKASVPPTFSKRTKTMKDLLG